MRAFVVLVLVLACGCIKVRIERLPTYVTAMQLQAAGDTRLLYGDALKVEELPDLTPYVILRTKLYPDDTEPAVRKIWDVAKELKADVVVIKHTGAVFQGTSSTETWGGWMTSPVYRNQTLGICCRLNPAALKFLADRTGRIVVLGGGSPLREAGLQEGDTLLSINSQPLCPEEGSIFFGRHMTSLATKPADDVTLVWMRPDKGRMEGKTKAQPNPPKHLGLPDAIPPEE